MAFLVERGQDTVHLTSYLVAHKASTSKLEVESVKKLSRDRFERAINKRGKSGGPSDGAATLELCMR